MMTTNTTQTVLIIEDNEDNKLLIEILLQSSGYLTLWAETGLKGVQLTLEKQPDFVLLDIQLPDIDGTIVLDKIRALDNKISQVPVIAMTSYAMTGDREKLLAAGCNGYIEKPIDALNVIDQIKAIIDQSQ